MFATSAASLINDLYKVLVQAVGTAVSVLSISTWQRTCDAEEFMHVTQEWAIAHDVDCVRVDKHHVWSWSWSKQSYAPGEQSKLDVSISMQRVVCMLVLCIYMKWHKNSD